MSDLILKKGLGSLPVIMIKNTFSCERIIWLILLSYPTLLLTVNGGMGVLYFLLLFASLTYLYRTRTSHSTLHWDSLSITFAIAMTLPMVAIFLSQAYHGNFSAPAYDWAARFLFCIPIFLALRQINLQAISSLEFGIPIGIIAGFAMLKLHPYEWGNGVSTTSHAFNLIHFNDTVLILGFLSFFSINWVHKDTFFLILLKLSAFVLGCYMSIQSGERGGWAAIPLLFLLWVVTFNRKKLLLKFSIAIPVALACLWLSYFLIHQVHTRIDLIFSDLDSYSHGNRDTSIGLRLQLYSAALHLFFEHPFFGVGPGEFANSMPALTASGMLTPLAGKAGLAEVHNEILDKCAETGLFGLIAILSVYFVPAFIFLSTSKSKHSNVRIASHMGLCLVLGFLVFGLTVNIFNLKMTAAFFSLTLAVLMATVTRRQQ
jgi:O-antigen ligase